MNTEVKASHHALAPGRRSAVDHQIDNYDSTKDKLLADLKMVVADAELLIQEAADSSSEGFAMLRTRFEKKLVESKAKLGRTRIAVGKKARHATDAAHAYVRENPWKAAGAFAVAGVIFGLLLSRRPAVPDADVSN